MTDQTKGGAAIPGQDPNAVTNADEAGKVQEGVQPNDGTPANDPAAAAPEKGKSLLDVAGLDTDNKATPDEGKKKPTVFEDLMEAKKTIKEQQATMAEAAEALKALTAEVRAGKVTPADAKDELDELAEEFELDPKFVKKLAATIENKSTKSIENKYLGDIKDIKAKGEQQTAATQAARLAKAVDLEIDRVLKANPQFEKIANPAVIKKYVMADKANLEKSMDDIFDEIYGGAVKDPASIEGYAGGAANNPKQIDFNNLDDEGHKEIGAARVAGGKEFLDYQDNLIAKLQNKGRSRHAQ